MKTPFCNFCIKSGILCERCLNKIKSGELSDIDIRIAKLLLKLEDKYPVLQKITYHNSYEVDDILAIVMGSGDLRLFFSGGGRLMREISENVRKKIRIVEKEGDVRVFLEDLFAPAKITAINKIWLPDGSTETRVILSGNARRLPLKAKVAKELAKKMRDITLRIAFENQPGRDF